MVKLVRDPIDYNYTNYVNWLGLFAQAEYTQDKLSAFAMGGVTTVKYSHWNHFYDGSDTDSYSSSYISTKDASDADWIEGLGDATGGHENDLWIEADPISTMQLKVESFMKWVMLYRFSILYLFLVKQLTKVISGLILV